MMRLGLWIVLLCLSWKPLKALDQHNIEKFNKCFTLLTQNTLQSQDPLVKEVQSGTLPYDQACLTLLNKASLNSQGVLINDDFRSQEVLRTLQSVHQTWFKSTMTYMPDDAPLLFDLIEFDEAALFVTKALFQKDWQYKDILLKPISLQGRRDPQLKSDYLIGPRPEPKILKRQEYAVAIAEDWQDKWSPPHLMRGPLRGIIEQPRDEVILPGFSHQLFFPTYYKEPLDIHHTLGGGFMGTNSYFLLNNGRAHGELSDGQNIMYRVFSQQLVQDILCRDLPVLTLEDAKPFVRNIKSVSWANNASCMACHATMDPMAALLRNAQMIVNDAPDDQGSTHRRLFKATKTPPESYQLYDAQEDYHLTPAHGRFVYRDIENRFYNKEVKSFQELGQIMAETADFYACATKRYFFYLTGQDVDMQLIQKNSPSPQGQFLYQLSTQLKEHQQLQKVLMSIIRSKWF